MSVCGYVPARLLLFVCVLMCVVMAGLFIACDVFQLLILRQINLRILLFDLNTGTEGKHAGFARNRL